MLRRFHIVIELLLIDAVLSGEQFCQLGLSHFKIGSLAPFHVLNPVPDDVFLDNLASFGFPAGLVCQIVVTLDVSQLSGQFEFFFTAGHNVSIRAELLLGGHL